jgi:hypothetical protein
MFQLRIYSKKMNDENLTTWGHKLHFPPKAGVLRISIALKNPLPPPGLNPRTLGPME